jgi:hypothetical protein
MKPKYLTIGIITSLLLCYVYDLMNNNSLTSSKVEEMEVEE